VKTLKYWIEIDATLWEAFKARLTKNGHDPHKVLEGMIDEKIYELEVFDSVISRGAENDDTG